MNELLTTLALIAFLSWREWLHYRQIEELTTKIKARSAEEYVLLRDMDRKTVEVPEVLPTPMDQIEPDQLLTALQKDDEQGQYE